MRSWIVGSLFLLLVLPSVALAQDSTISGEVTDNTGGVLPGVTVEVSSPVMIEGSRVAVTDGQGRFAVVNLRPGTYSVTFTLPGFSTVVRDEIELTAGFTAAVDVQLAVGAIEETITVSGQSPTIDVQQVRERQVVTKEVLDTLPMSKDWAAIGALTVGIDAGSQDVGGVREAYMPHLSAHGGDSRDGMRQMDGMSMGNLSCGYSCTTLQPNDAMTEELSYEIGAVSADVAIGGVRVNIIPKEGGNTFSGSLFANFSNDSLQGNNQPQDLVDRGLTEPDVLESIWDQSAELGGPIVRDRLWFHGSYRRWGTKIAPTGAFYDADPNPFNYVADESRPGVDELYNQSVGLRLTYQANQQHKFAAYYNTNPRHVPFIGVSNVTTPQASRDQRNPLNYHTTATWTGTLSSRVLVEAGFGAQVQDATVDPQPGQGQFSHFRELTTGKRFGGSGIIRRWLEVNKSYKASVSYVTGSHSLKIGMNLNEGRWRQGNLSTGPSDSWNFLLGGRPFLIVPFATPYTVSVDLDNDLGLYAQDTWTLGNTTLNLGLRWDYVKQSVPVQDTSIFVDQPAGSNAAGTWAPIRQFDAVPSAADWKDISPRIGVAHDVFGDGRTAIKVSVSRYLRVDTIAMGASRNPVNTVAISDQRFWNDANGDFFPDESELTPFRNSNFGTTNITTFFDEDVYSGFGNRRSNWEYSVGVEHEILPRTSVAASYWRRTQHGFSITDNQLVDPSDFDEFCVTPPNDPRLPSDVRGNQICGLYDLNPSKLGQVRNQIQLASPAGYEMTQAYDGIDFSLNSQISSDLFFYGGVSTGRTKFDDCNARVDNPSVSPRTFVQEGGAGSAGGWDYEIDDNGGIELPIGHHCESSPPFWRPSFKFTGAYTMPYDVQVSAALQNLPGIPVRAVWTIDDPDVQGLGRPLTGQQDIELIEPGTLYADRLNQLDLRVTKIFELAGTQRLKIMFDAYNLFNNAAPLVYPENHPYGDNWLLPENILLARFVKFGAQFNF